MKWLRNKRSRVEAQAVGTAVAAAADPTVASRPASEADKAAAAAASRTMRKIVEHGKDRVAIKIAPEALPTRIAERF
jgi:hypothetical protein